MISACPLKLVPCSYCAGHGYVPTEYHGTKTCPSCNGGTFAPVWGDLGETRTYPKGRPFVYNPGTGDLAVTRGRDRTTYILKEFPCDQTPGAHPVRAFSCTKTAKNGKPIERYDLELGAPGFHKCSCMGFLSEAVERGNKNAWQDGSFASSGSFGCVHLDACLRFFWDGLFEIEKVEEVVS